MATCSPGETLILPRNSHISATSGMVLSGAVPKYVIPEYNSQWDIACGVTPLQVESAIKELAEDGKKAAAVLVTSPTYHGICSKLSGIAEVCHSHGIPVIVDEAHGAHFKFHPGFPSTALEQGADLTAQSTHKVLCSLTQSSMLHVGGTLIDREHVGRCLQMLQSSSPSYLLLASLDAARAQLSENPDTIFDEAVILASETRKEIEAIPGISVLSSSDMFSSFSDIDPLRVTVSVSQLGLSGYEADDILAEEHQIISELAGTRSITFAINLGTCGEDIQKLISSIKHLSATFFKKNRSHPCMEDGVTGAPFADVHMSLSPRDAFFAKKRKVDIWRSIGQVSGELICPYPPGIPVLIPGEVITEEAVNYLLHLRKKGAMISGAADRQLSSVVVCDR
uniref:Arginine decarboxylase n=2 Tax=Anthurium amnicola TaxID=1678845 RepID=A0A1D1XTK8_9ARAE